MWLWIGATSSFGGPVTIGKSGRCRGLRLFPALPQPGKRQRRPVREADSIRLLAAWRLLRALKSRDHVGTPPERTCEKRADPLACSCMVLHDNAHNTRAQARRSPAILLSKDGAAGQD